MSFVLGTAAACGVAWASCLAHGTHACVVPSCLSVLPGVLAFPRTHLSRICVGSGGLGPAWAGSRRVDRLAAARRGDKKRGGRVCGRVLCAGLRTQSEELSKVVVDGVTCRCREYHLDRNVRERQQWNASDANKIRFFHCVIGVAGTALKGRTNITATINQPLRYSPSPSEHHRRDKASP